MSRQNALLSPSRPYLANPLARLAIMSSLRLCDLLRADLEQRSILDVLISMKHAILLFHSIFVRSCLTTWRAF